MHTTEVEQIEEEKEDQTKQGQGGRIENESPNKHHGNQIKSDKRGKGSK